MKALGFSLLILALAGCGRSGGSSTAQESPPTHLEIWEAIEPLAARYRIAPEFVYALVAAESNFNPKAESGSAHGLLQIKPAAWRAVSKQPYESNVGDWRKNLTVGIDYLAFSRAYLHRKTEFSYPLLLAAFHYGLDYVEARNFDVRRIPIPDNPVYRELWAGNLAPVAPPR